MCDPITIGLTVAAAVVTAGGQMYAADAQAKQYKYMAAVDQQNKALSLKERDDANRRGELEQMRHWRKVAQLQGQQIAEMGAEGLDLGFGTALDIQDETLAMGFEDASILEENKVREARGYEIQAINYGNSAKANKANAKAAKTAGYISAAGTLLGAAAQVSGKLATPGGGSPSKAASASLGNTASFISKNPGGIIRYGFPGG